MKDSFWTAVVELFPRATVPFVSVEGDEEEVYQPLFEDNNEEKVCLSVWDLL